MSTKKKPTKKPTKKAAPKKAAPKKAASKKAAPKKAASKKAAPKKAAASKGASWKPSDWRVLTVGCAVKRASMAVGFYQAWLGAKVRTRMDTPDGHLAHADLAVGDANFMIGEPMNGPEQTMSCMLYTPNPDQLFNQGLASGCEQVEAMTNQFWGDRTGRLVDPFGNSWMIAKKVEDVSPAEMARRVQKLFGPPAA